MQRHTKLGKTLALITVGLVAVAALIVAGCTAGLAGSSAITAIISTPVSVPVTITDDPGDQILAASLTLNSVVLTNTKGQTASILAAPLTFEASHLDAVQEPLFIPSIPQDSYTSVTLTYANPVVIYLDASTKQVVTANATLAGATQTITFASPITIDKTQMSLLVDFLVAKSVAISGTSVTVTPNFAVRAVPIPQNPTNGTNGLYAGVKGKVSAVGTNQFTMLDPRGISVTITVDTNTQYQGPDLAKFADLTAGMMVEADIQILTNGTMLAKRVEEHVAPNTRGHLLLGPVVTVTGSPATSFVQATREHVVASGTAPTVEKNTINITSATKFLMPGRFQNTQAGGVPWTPTFSASTLFAGQVVNVATTNLSSNTATADAVMLAPQTVGGTITSITTASGWTSVTLTLPTASWLATLTGQTSVVVMLPPSPVATTASAAPKVGDTLRFSGFLFNKNGTLVLFAAGIGPGPGQQI